MNALFFQTCNHGHTGWRWQSHDDTFHLAHNRQEICSSSRRTGLNTVQDFHVSLFLHFRYWRGFLLWVRISCVSPLHPTLSSRSPVACMCRKQQASLLEQDPIVSRWKLSSVFRSVSEFFALSLCCESLRKLLLGTIQLWNSVWSGNFADASPRRDNSELSCRLSTSPQTQGVVSHRHKTYLSSGHVLLAVTKKQGKGVDCNGTSVPLFSIPSLLRILDIISNSRWCFKFLE